jgi:hypothetical protein
MDISDEVLAAIESAPIATRRRWYAELNSWTLPADFPIQGIKPCEEAGHHVGSDWYFAMRALETFISEQDRSWGWWKHNIGRTFAEWSAWWKQQGRKVSISDEQEETP